MGSITNKKILDSLLGKSDADKEDDFLALCFSSDENAEKYELVREDLIESYLRGILSKNDQHRFETYFLRDYHHRELFEFAKDLRGQLSENKQLEAVVKEKSVRKSGSFVSVLIPIGVCAAVLLVGVLVWRVAVKNPEIEVAEVKPTPTAVIIPQISPTATPSPIPAVSPTPLVLQSPKSTPTPKPSETPASKAAENPIMAFALPLIAKGKSDNILRIPKYKKQITLQTPKPFKEFPGYEVSIQKDGTTLWKNDFENFPVNDKNQIEINVPAEKFQNGNLRFIITGKNADGSTEELKGTERFFKVEKEK